MNRYKLLVTSLVVGGFALATTPVLGQSTTEILSKVRNLEAQMVRLEQMRQSDLSWISDHVAALQAGSPNTINSEDLAPVEERLNRLEDELGTLKAVVESDRSLEMIDSLSITLGVLMEGRGVEEEDRRLEVIDSLSTVLGSLMGRMSALLTEAEQGTEVQRDAPAITVPASPTQLRPQTPPVTFGGQIRPRFESRKFSSETATDDWFTSMRVRGTLKADLDDGVQVFLQFQDVRLWGEETSTLGDFRADNLDLHQGYIQVSDVAGLPVSVRLGRQAVSLGGQRLIGAVEWTQQGRVFDGGRVTFASGGTRVDFIGMRLWESTAPSVDTDGGLFGVYAAIPNVGSGTLDLYVLHNRVSAEVLTRQTTVGARWHGSQAGFKYRAEASHQTGTRSGKEVSAYMVGARVGAPLSGGRASVTLWYDYLSGDDTSDEKIQSFGTLFATNHKFYGFADLFLNIPVHTGGHGLQDFAVKFSAKTSTRTKVGVDLHSFYAARQGELSTRHFANEADVTFTFAFSRQLTLVSGFSYIATRGALAEIGRDISSQTFTYLMTNVTF